MMKRTGNSLWLVRVGVLFPLLAQGQITLQGRVVDMGGVPLPGANILQVSTLKGTSTDANGRFTLQVDSLPAYLLVTFVGYTPETLRVDIPQFVEIRLTNTVELNTYEIIEKTSSTEISMMDPKKIERISEKELTKAACCNLSESFETTPSVDVTFSDALTANRQIELLGLSGKYLFLSREGIPYFRGLMLPFGMSFIPGTWIDNINLSKGIGCVTGTYESISGQIDVELKKPETAEKFYLNLYASEGGRWETNLNHKHTISDKLSTLFMWHTKHTSMKNDRNGDSFLDMPLQQEYIGLNRWKIRWKNNWQSQIGIIAIYNDLLSGQMEYSRNKEPANSAVWGMWSENRRIDLWMKTGKTYTDMPWKSAGIQAASSLHQMQSVYGIHIYKASQMSYYVNFLYKSIVGNTRHSFVAGITSQGDEVEEYWNYNTFKRFEQSAGTYLEYTFTPHEKFNLVLGERLDYHNYYRLLWTPRLHIRWALSENHVIRLSAGKGIRSPYLLVENYQYLLSSRNWIILPSDNTLPYGLLPEKAWNYGINYTRNFRWPDRKGTFTCDVYRTDFIQQIVVDVYQSAREVRIYNLRGRSFSNSFQTQLDYEVLKNLFLRLAYRFHDVWTTYSGILMRRPLQSLHRTFINLSYEWGNDWKMDITTSWQSKKRLPYTGDNPPPLQRNEYSLPYSLTFAQVSKMIKKKWDIYVGVENIFDFRQNDPIVMPSNPYSPYFDASMIWGPVFGRMIYVGLRYKVADI